jgi:hypothetical protein
VLEDFKGHELTNHNEIESVEAKTDCIYFRCLERCAVGNKNETIKKVIIVIINIVKYVNTTQCT